MSSDFAIYQYVEPISNRIALDVQNKTSKGYFNIVDWNRIRNNTYLIGRAISFFKGQPEYDMFDPDNEDLFLVPLATIDTVPLINGEYSYPNFYWVCQNLRVVSTMTAGQYGYTELTYSFSNQPGGRNLKWTDVNIWENNLHIIYTHLAEHFGFVDWVDPLPEPTWTPRCSLFGAGYDRILSNYFRQY